LLDGLVRYQFGENAELMGAWASARNVETVSAAIRRSGNGKQFGKHIDQT
jgi:hypothetical protein